VKTFPANLIVERKPCLVVGAGSVATRKILSLVNLGADVTVTAPEASDQVKDLALADEIRWEQRKYRRGEVVGYWLVCTATGDPETDMNVSLDATRARIWVNVADDPHRSTFLMPAVFRNGDITVSVSTGGMSPAFSSYLRDQLADTIEDKYAKILALIDETRQHLKSSSISTEGLNWKEILNKELFDLYDESGIDKIKEKIYSWENDQYKKNT
jgi:precorrin-2 dehydrogenase/sirohydrochlorin ferrochelatase